MKKRSNIITVAKKEFMKFFGDKQTVIMALIFPGVFIYLMYTFLGSALPALYTPDSAHTASVKMVNRSDALSSLLESANMTVSQISGSEIDAAKAEITDKTLDLLIIMPPEFDKTISRYEAGPSYQPPQIEIFYNSSEKNSRGAFETAGTMLTAYEATLANAFDYNSSTETAYNLVTDKDMITGMYSSLLTMLLLMMSLPSCVNLAATAIAGEKDAGTITTLLVTPLSRRSLAVGKIFSLSVLGFCCGLSSFLGVFFSLPKLMNMEGQTAGSITNIYGMPEYLLIALVILSAMLFVVAVVSIISAIAKSAKAATSMVTLPLMIINIVLSLSVMLTDGAQTGLHYYFIPIYNTVQSLVSVFSTDYSIINVLCSILTNIVYAGIGVVVLAKIFNTERIIFTYN